MRAKDRPGLRGRPREAGIGDVALGEATARGIARDPSREAGGDSARRGERLGGDLPRFRRERARGPVRKRRGESPTAGSPLPRRPASPASVRASQGDDPSRTTDCGPRRPPVKAGRPGPCLPRRWRGADREVPGTSAKTRRRPRSRVLLTSHRGHRASALSPAAPVDTSRRAVRRSRHTVILVIHLCCLA